MSGTTENSRRLKKAVYLILILLLPAAIYFILTTGKHNMLSLPFYGEREVESTMLNGEQVFDTIYHTLPDFSLVNHKEETVTINELQGNIVIANFFFTACPTICPKMTSGLVYVNDKLKDYPDILLISHTVDPENDTPEVLSEYAQRVKAKDNWQFLTGNKEDIYKLAVNGYLLSASEDVLAPGGFLHSELVVLLDREQRIRGFYDGTNLQELNRLIDEVKVLIAWEMIPRKK
jgi:protein SCO1